MSQSASWVMVVASCFAVSLTVFLVPKPAPSEANESDARNNSVAAHILDGKKFIGQTGEKGKKAHHEDILTFIDGIFTSAACLKSGFGSGPYTAVTDADGIHFEAEIFSPDHGMLAWKGTLKNDTLDVTYAWSKKRWFWTIYREYWFRGSRAE